MSMVHSNGIEDCYQKCKDLVGCQSFVIIYNLEMFEYIEGELNECHLKSRKYGVGATARVGLKAVNMDCLIGLCYFPIVTVTMQGYILRCTTLTCIIQLF